MLQEMPTELTLYLMYVWKWASKNKKEIGMVGNSQVWKQRLHHQAESSNRAWQILGLLQQQNAASKGIHHLVVRYIFRRKAFLFGWCITRQYNHGTSSINIFGRYTSSQGLLKCFHEEADDRMLIHVNHAVRVKNFRNVIVASSDTDLFVNLVYHFTRWIYADLEQLWIVSRKKGSENAVPIHVLGERLDDRIIEILPAIHVLTG